MKKHKLIFQILRVFILVTFTKSVVAQSSVKIPEIIPTQQEWMINNLNVSHFRNGNPILEAKTDLEWKQAGNNKQPAGCYYLNDSLKYQAIYGKLYNWYAVNDPRGLAPLVWHIP